ncbi:hypothetical protein PRLR5107_02800 [Prevotella lacticifex]|uniref:Uncharacterized protein n=1 Tax=Prevotella lacticifex TaxID=2854755 RepID=A0A9R1CZD5_9BACT|nr:hypothetical protein PRLR5003_16240 [Prevotella lacticifex]GJG38326.1 hypothetical protein PRLR5019_02970 [Prevotella lacticifex]GJG42991.1 hypothetical protein PRLR5025_17770 [Prevotella lacticifex]GJG44683.1 hypothetical protein PRLR5027_02780 [Prevotella lacticifex]GJG49342.1 hypothetical protein PRLR5052_17550 [Prevotella lacticifex]
MTFTLTGAFDLSGYLFPQEPQTAIVAMAKKNDCKNFMTDLSMINVYPNTFTSSQCCCKAFVQRPQEKKPCPAAVMQKY